MFEQITRQHNEALDEIIKARHTVRAFEPEAPDEEDIRAIIQAGLLAPFGAVAVAGKPDFKKVLVIPGTSLKMTIAAQILQARMGKFTAEMAQKGAPTPFVQRLKDFAEHGVPGVGNAPYLVIVAERNGMPPVAPLSLSYCLANMWLKATALGIGLQLVSAIRQLDQDQEFCDLIGLPSGEYSLDACALGYPADTYQPPQVEYPSLEQAVEWL